MRDTDCIGFLQWALPRLGLSWPGFRKVRRQVCRRLARRLDELQLADLGAYRRHLGTHGGEWARLDHLCYASVSRFYRDRHVFQVLAQEVLPHLVAQAAASSHPLRVWCAGCASGEEPYSVALLASFTPALQGYEVEIVATDYQRRLLERARRAGYPPGCLRELPRAWRQRAFTTADDGSLRLRPIYRRMVELRHQDLRREAPAGRFHLIFCRNLAFTYFAPELRGPTLERLEEHLAPGGALILGGHEDLPPGARGFEAWPGEPRVLLWTGRDPG